MTIYPSEVTRANPQLDQIYSDVKLNGVRLVIHDVIKHMMALIWVAYKKHIQDLYLHYCT